MVPQCFCCDLKEVNSEIDLQELTLMVVSCSDSQSLLVFRKKSLGVPDVIQFQLV